MLNRRYLWSLLAVVALTSPVLAGPDVVVSYVGYDNPNFVSVAFYGLLNPDAIGNGTPGNPFNGDEVAAYAITTTSCNIGTVTLDWFSGTNQHPVIAQNMYRLKNGRFEQIGLSWLKHGWCGADSGTCTFAGGPPTCSDDGNCSGLGVGCNDTYDAGLNADQTSLGPRSEVNATTGAFPFPPTLGWSGGGAFGGTTGNSVYKRLQVRAVDVHPDQNPNAIYYVEGHYVHPDDATLADDNNASYRRITINSALSSSIYDPDDGGPQPPVLTVNRQPAIHAWQVQDPGVMLNTVDVAGDGRFYVGSRATDNGNGTWHYEYAVYNMNSHRSCGSFAVALSGACPTNVGFRDVFYHSGEPYDPVPDNPAVLTTYGPVASDDWPGVISGGGLTWSTTPFATNPNANAIRWATLYNFRFDANIAPQAGIVTLGLFRPGSPTSVTVAAVVPGSSTACCCPGDVSGDNSLNARDIQPFVAQYLGQATVGPCASGIAAPVGTLDSADLTGLVNILLQPNPSCP